MTLDLRAVAHRYREVVGGEPRVTRHWNDDESVWVDIFSAADRPQPGVTTWATLGMSRFDADYEVADGRDMRVELVGEVDSAVTTFGHMLTSCALNLVGGGYGLELDTVYPDIVRQYEPDVSTAHMLLTGVFSFEGLDEIEGDDEVLVFLQAVPITDDEFAFARRHDAEDLADLLARVRPNLLDLDRPSVVPAVQLAAPVYCERFDPLRFEPVAPLDEVEARRRYVEGPTFTVVLPDDDTAVPRAVLEVDAGASRVMVTFLGVRGAVGTTYLFRRRGERLFFEQIDVYGYPGEDVVAELDVDLAVATPYSPSNVVRHEQFWFRPDGVGRRTLDDAGRPTIEAEDRRDVPVDDLWEPVPEFGDWSSIGRYER